MIYRKLNKKSFYILFLLFFTLVISLYYFISKDSDLSKLKNCSLEKIEIIPQNSIVVIGHAYGSPLNANKNDYISNKVDNFLNKNKEKIKKLILTGDVFWEPTHKKWNKLFLQYKDYFNIHVAPGNHDIDNEKKIVFKNSYFKNKNFYNIESLENNSYFIENSIINNWHLNPFMIREMKFFPENSYTVFRHNIAIKELVKFANSNAFLSKTLPSVKNLQLKVKDIKNVTIISGDGGAFKKLPRITCYSYKNIKFVINGIGDFLDDQIIIIKNNKFFKYNLK